MMKSTPGETRPHLMNNNGIKIKQVGHMKKCKTHLCCCLTCVSEITGEATKNGILAS